MQFVYSPKHSELMSVLTTSIDTSIDYYINLYKSEEEYLSTEERLKPFTQKQVENINKWIKALRSGNYKQTPFNLHNNIGYCCLGVGCDLIDSNAWVRWNDEDYYFTYAPENQNEEDREWMFMPASVRAEYGLSDYLMRFMTKLNDCYNKDFNFIADFLETLVKLYNDSPE